MQKKKILITGGAGFLGANLIEGMTQLGYRITATYHTAPLLSLPCEWIHLDLLNHQSVENHVLWNEYDCIIHCAAMSKLPACESDRKLAFQTNVSATRVLSEESSLHHSKFIFISTDLVFSGTHGWYVEDDQVNPQSYYAETKCLAEQDVRLICPDYIILRIALMYGNHNSNLGGFLSWTVEKMMKNEALHLYMNQFRAIMHVTDAVYIIDRILHSNLSNQTFHAAGPERLNRVEIGKRVAHVFGIPNPHIIPTRIPRSITLGESDDIALRTDKLRSALGMEFTPVFQGLYKTFHTWKARTHNNENITE